MHVSCQRHAISMFVGVWWGWHATLTYTTSGVKQLTYPILCLRLLLFNCRGCICFLRNLVVTCIRKSICLNDARELKETGLM